MAPWPYREIPTPAQHFTDTEARYDWSSRPDSYDYRRKVIFRMMRIANEQSPAVFIITDVERNTQTHTQTHISN